MAYVMSNDRISEELLTGDPIFLQILLWQILGRNFENCVNEYDNVDDGMVLPDY